MTGEYRPGTDSQPDPFMPVVIHVPDAWLRGSGGVVWHSTHTSNDTALCPDLLSIRDIGVADNLRGRVVRAFFRAISWWKP